MGSNVRNTVTTSSWDNIQHKLLNPLKDALRKTTSPKIVLLLDMDDTIIDASRHNAIPTEPTVVKIINSMLAQGHKVRILTARREGGMTLHSELRKIGVDPQYAKLLAETAIFTGGKGIDKGSAFGKHSAYIDSKVGACVFVDDLPYNLRDFEKAVLRNSRLKNTCVYTVLYTRYRNPRA